MFKKELTVQEMRALIDERQTDLFKWLRAEGRDIIETQAHLRGGSIEQAYWHYGYAIALRDVLQLLEGGDLELTRNLESLPRAKRDGAY